MRVISLVGARPQFIKEAILHHEFVRRGIEEILVNSGQHYDLSMSDVFFDNLKIAPPKYNLGVGSGSHGEMTARVMTEFEKVVIAEKPEMVLVYGDTNTTLAGAIVAAKLKVAVAHVEAGVRMLPKNMPEEINRCLTDRVSNLLFCSSERCVQNLKREGIESGVYFTGDVMYDLFLAMRSKFSYQLFENLQLEENNYALMTLHRDYNVDDPSRLKSILTQVRNLSEKLRIIFPIHPRARKKITEYKLEPYLEKVTILDPIDYLNLMGLTVKAKFIITDSGGLQKESYFAGKQAFLFMPDPAWHELVDEGINFLINDGDLCEIVSQAGSAKFSDGIYGSGNAGSRIVDIILNEYGQRK